MLPAGLRFKTYLLIFLMVDFGPLGDVLLGKGVKQRRRSRDDWRPPSCSTFSFAHSFPKQCGSGLVRCCFFSSLTFCVLSWADYSLRAAGIFDGLRRSWPC